MTKLEWIHAFNIQVSLILILIVFIIKPILATLILRLWKIVSRGKFEIKEHPLFGTIKWFFVYVSFIIAFRLLPFSTKILSSWEILSRIITILFITKFLTVLVSKDSKIMQKTVATSKNETVNTFVCKIIRGIIWICSIFIIIKELGYDLTGLAAGLGIRQCYYFTSSTGYC